MKLVKESLNEKTKTEVILDMISATGKEGAKYTDIIRLAYELTHGPESYNSKKRGYWSGAFKTPTPDDRTFGHLIKYIEKNDKGRWVLRNKRMTPEEMNFHSNRINYQDSDFKPDLYKH